MEVQAQLKLQAQQMIMWFNIKNKISESFWHGILGLICDWSVVVIWAVLLVLTIMGKIDISRLGTSVPLGSGINF